MLLPHVNQYSTLLVGESNMTFEDAMSFVGADVAAEAVA